MVENNKPDNDALETALEKLKPILSKLSFGMFAGYTSGYATKKIGKVAAVLVGVGFIFLQSLASAGYIEIDWLKVQDTAVKKLDIVSFVLCCVCVCVVCAGMRTFWHPPPSTVLSEYLIVELCHLSFDVTHCCCRYHPSHHSSL
jgi:uncharacterized membrane protein (Fun14 family)